jgi:hypothetical protein
MQSRVTLNSAGQSSVDGPNFGRTSFHVWKLYPRLERQSYSGKPFGLANIFAGTRWSDTVTRKLLRINRKIVVLASEMAALLCQQDLLCERYGLGADFDLWNIIESACAQYPEWNFVSKDALAAIRSPASAGFFFGRPRRSTQARFKSSG